jgi:mycothiol synthase
MTTIPLPLSASAIPGLTFRTLQVDVDYPQIVAINNICWPLDGRLAMETVEDRQRHWGGMENFDPHNVLVVEVGGVIIGYATITWEERSDSERWFYIYGVLLPQWRCKDIGGAMQDWIETRSHEINATLPAKENCLFDAYCFDVVIGKMALLAQRGFQVSWHGDMMDRSLDEPIPNFELPAGIEVRPVQAAHLRQIYEAQVESDKPASEPFAATEAQVKDFVAYWGTDHLDLWQVAWDVASNKIACVVICTANEVINPRNGMNHGFLEHVFTLHNWRKRGLAKALIARCLTQLKQRGMGVVTVGRYDDNANAIKLYESFGFRNALGMTGYQKRLVNDAD